MFEEVQNLGHARYDDLPLQAKSGKIIPVEFVNNYDDDGIKVIQCNIREITERKLHEARLRRLTNFYAALSACNKSIVRCTSEASLLRERYVARRWSSGHADGLGGEDPCGHPRMADRGPIRRPRRSLEHGWNSR